MTRLGVVARRAVRLLGLAPRVARLALIVTLACAGLQIGLGRVVSGKVDDALVELGAGLARMSGGSGGPRLLELNGALLHLETAARAEPVAAVLDRAETRCAGGAGPAGLWRGDDGWRGFVACFARLGAAETGTVGEVPATSAPAYRYVYAQAGGAETQVVTLWAEDPLDLPALFPPAGDAPGRDAPGVPRPPGARRLLSARETGHGQEIVIYVDSARGAGELAGWYRGALAGLGWRVLAAAAPDRVLVALRRDAMIALVFSVDEAGAGTVAVMTTAGATTPAHDEDRGGR